jgi:hypothetical protein
MRLPEARRLEYPREAFFAPGHDPHFRFNRSGNVNNLVNNPVDAYAILISTHLTA